VIGLLGKMGIELSSVAGGASTMVIAYAIHKVSVMLRKSNYTSFVINLFHNFLIASTGCFGI